MSDPDDAAKWQPMPTQLPSTARQRRLQIWRRALGTDVPRGRRDAGRPVATAALRRQHYDAAGPATSRLRSHNMRR